MRSWVMMAVVLGVLVAGFAVFMLTQSSVQTGVQKTRFTTSMPGPATGVSGDGGLGAGEHPRAQVFDKKTGELSYDFGADHFDAPVNNVMHLIRPDMRFYSKDGQVLTLEAETGDMTMPESAKKGPGLTNMQSQPPSNGILYDVTLGLLETADDDEPVMTCRIPILAFDNDTLRLNTVQTTIDGRDVLPDRVPVTVRGRDYDFDGEGLTVRYNQRDRRLEFLEVAHGRRLLIKNPKAFGPMPAATTQTVAPRAAGPLWSDGRPIELVSTDPKAGPRLSAEERASRLARHDAATRRAAKHPVATKPVTTRPAHEIVAYQANFQDDVHIKEGDAPIGTADRMLATFTFEQKDATTQPATVPAATAPAGSADSPRDRATVAAKPQGTPATRRARPVTRPLAVSPAPTATPSSVAVPSDEDTAPQPIEITWTGKLTVVPEKLATSGLKSLTDRIVEFFGRPVHLQRDGSTIDAAYVWAGVIGNRFVATPDATTPRVTLHDAGGNVVTTTSIHSDGDTAVLKGDSVAELVMAGQEGRPAQKVVTKWTDTGTLHLVPGPNGQQSIDRAVFRGDVDVKHPQLKMTTDLLELGLKAEPGKTQPSLTSVHADGRVNAAVTGDDGGVQTIKSKTLDLGTAQQTDGTLAIRTLHAVGDVIAADAKQTLMADDLATTLSPPPAGEKSPTTKPQNPAGVFAVDNLTAAGHVHFDTVDGTAAVADTLTLEKQAGQQWVTLVGTPARVSDSQSDVSGATIRVDAAGNHALIDGAGTLTSRQKQAGDDATKKPQPITVVWTESMTYDGPAERAWVKGDVVVTSVGTDTSANTAKGRLMEIVVVDAPADTTNPDKPAPTAGPATRAGLAGIGGGKKVVQSLTLSDPNDVEVSSLLHAPTDPTRLIRRTYLYGKSVTVKTNPDGSPGAITVPGGGRMLYEDIVPPVATKPATTQPAGGRGTIAMQWSNGMTYDPATLKAVLDGDVVVVRRSADAPPMTMLAPRLIADVSDAKSGSQLKRMTADQGATLSNSQMRIETAKAVYEPASDRIIATGTPRRPVQLYDQTGLSNGTIEEVWWNVKTNQPEKLKNVSVQVNR